MGNKNRKAVDVFLGKYSTDEEAGCIIQSIVFRLFTFYYVLFYI
jgi:hypothetical protein